MSFATHILLATDFSPTAERATAQAHELAQRLGSRVTVAHVHDTSVPVADEAGRRLETPEELSAHLEAQLDKVCAATFADVAGVQRVLLQSSDIAKALCAYAAKHQVDLIVAGKAGVTGLVRLIMGSVAEETVRHAPCAVLITP